MSANPLPYLPHTPDEQAKVDRLDWTEGKCFSAYGLRFGLRSNNQADLEQAARQVPFGWQPTPMGEVDILYSFRRAAPSPRAGQPNYLLLYCGSVLLARNLELAPLLTDFERHAELLTALRAKNCLFVHAGVVGWKGKAILIPGRSMTGKTTLVQELVQAGATYYSDEFAVLDPQGQAHPYPVPLSIRSSLGQPGRKTPIEELGGQPGVAPLPIGLVVVTQYQPSSKWHPRGLTASQSLLALMDNTVAAEREPQYTMPILRQSVIGARTIQSKRGEADQIAPTLLRMCK
jgi:hypothetical protein